MRTSARQDSAGITLADTMIAVIGVAIGFVVEPVRAETSAPLPVAVAP